MLSAVIFDGIEYRMFNRIYAVSRRGEILKRLKPFNPRIRKDGYAAAGRDFLVHRMVAVCWLVKPPNTHLVHHRNENKTDNRADNLEWVTPTQHIKERHAGKIGVHTVTDEVKQRMRLMRLGTKDSDTTRNRKRVILLQVSTRKNSCMVDGKIYRSFLSASKALGIHFHTVRYRCLSKNFPNYRLVTSS